MQVDIKNINIKSLLFSALPLAVFALMLVGIVIQLMITTPTEFISVLGVSITRAVVLTLVTMLCVAVGAFVYNLLCSVGLKGIRLNLEDVIEETKGE
ncbi:dolichyl-phosphate-mannose--protein O-mannosyl transferase [Elusimicrobium posterum]|uniref:hypothetical protein n=1 Tax=Elusimicrobium posterum TaxID=3116653 RepID=UPI003C74C647